MTLRRRIGSCIYWLAIMALSGCVWWLVNDWLEPKPVWSVPIDDTLVLTHYQPSQNLLAGFRSKSNKQMEVVVLDPASGIDKARLSVEASALKENSDYQPIDIGPRLYGDTIVRFTSRTLENGENQVEFRSWKYASEARETELASWRMPSMPVKYNVTLSGMTNYQQEWIKTVWSMSDVGQVLIYRYFPTDQILNELRRGFNLDLNLGWMEVTRYCYLSVCVCEVWRRDESTNQFKKASQYSIPMVDRATSQNVATHHYSMPIQSNWSSDGKHFFNPIPWNQGISGVNQIEALTGVVKPHFPFEGDKQGYGSHTTGEILLLRRNQIVDHIEQGKLMHKWIRTPDKLSKLIWSIDEWRPLLNATTLKKVEWPATLDHRIVGNDLLMVDSADPTRYLYHTNVWDQSPYWQRPSHGGTDSHFIFMRYHEGKLKIENQWQYDGGGQWWNSALCGQLFVVGQQDLDWSDPFVRMLQWVRPLWLYYFERIKVNAPYVAEVAIKDGTMRWKKLERELAPIPFLDKDYLLLRFRRTDMANYAGYECWKLPIEVTSAWWGCLSGLGVFTMLVLWSMVASRKRLRLKA